MRAVLPNVNPPSSTIPIQYESSTRSINNAGNRYAQVNWNANNMFDKQGTILTNNAVYINSVFGRYGVYLVKKTVVEATFTNLEQFAVEIIYTPTLIQPLVSSSFDDAINASYAPENKRIVLAEQYGKNQHTIKKTVNWGLLYGNEPAYVSSELFSGNAFSGPTNTNYHNFTILAPRNLTLGVDVVFKERDIVLFYLNIPSTAISRINPRTGLMSSPHHYLEITKRHMSKSNLITLSHQQNISTTGTVEQLSDSDDEEEPLADLVEERTALSNALQVLTLKLKVHDEKLNQATRLIKV